MRYIDIHSHLHFDEYSEDRDEIIKQLEEKDIGFITVGTDLDTSESGLLLAKERTFSSYTTAGIHPTHSIDLQGVVRSDADFSRLREIANDPHVIAIGECGLDYYRLEESTKELQKQVFSKQIEIANELNKPLMLHIRNAYRDAYEVLRQFSKVKGNVHFFAGTWEEAQLFLNFGFTLSFTGVITFTHDYDEVIKHTPLEMIMSETDAPYVTPHPFRGKRNEPKHVELVVKKIAEIKGIDEEEVRIQILANAHRVFNLGLGV